MHMLAEIPPKVAISGFMGYLKGKAAQSFMRGIQSCDISTEIESFAAEDTI